MLELYVKDGCPYCRKQIEQLDQERISYQLRNVSRDQGALKELRKSTAQTLFPCWWKTGRSNRWVTRAWVEAFDP